MKIYEWIKSFFTNQNNMDTQVYGEVPIFNRKQVRDLYAKAVKQNMDNFDPGEMVEIGIMPFPGDDEIKSYDESVQQGLEYAIGMIDEANADALPPVFMIDTMGRDGSKGKVWIIANGEVASFTRVNVVNKEDT